MLKIRYRKQFKRISKRRFNSQDTNQNFFRKSLNTVNEQPLQSGIGTMHCPEIIQDSECHILPIGFLIYKSKKIS